MPLQQVTGADLLCGDRDSFNTAWLLRFFAFSSPKRYVMLALLVFGIGYFPH